MQCWGMDNVDRWKPSSLEEMAKEPCHLGFSDMPAEGQPQALGQEGLPLCLAQELLKITRLSVPRHGLTIVLEEGPITGALGFQQRAVLEAVELDTVNLVHLGGRPARNLLLVLVGALNRGRFDALPMSGLPRLAGACRASGPEPFPRAAMATAPGAREMATPSAVRATDRTWATAP